MKEANTFFTFNEGNIIIQFKFDDKMKSIWKKYTNKINQELNSLLFLNEEDQINFDLNFKKQTNQKNLDENKMNILVFKKEEKIISKNLDEIILLNNETIENINNIQILIDNAIKLNTTDSKNAQLKIINQLLNKVNDNIKNNEKSIINLFNDYNKNNINKNKNNINYAKNNINGKKNKTNLIKNIIIQNKVYTNNIYKKLFSYVIEKRKLKLIKYDKDLQNKIDISLNNYKFYSGKYIIYEEKGKGKEFKGVNDKLIYEGEFLNGERNGKGKEYNNYGELIYEGEFLNGERN